MRHGAAIQGSGSGAALPALRSLQKALTRLHEDLAATCDANMYALEYLCSAGEGTDGQQREERRAAGDGRQQAAMDTSSESEDEE